MRQAALLGVMALAAIVCARGAEAAAQVITGVGGNNTSVIGGSANAARLAFESAIGGINNGTSPPAASGFRTVTWDGVPDSLSSPHLLAPDYYNTAGNRHGVQLIAPGAGVQVSQSGNNGTIANFGNINATYATNFNSFSPLKVFAPSGTNLIVIYFYRVGTTERASVRGFGAIFNDVEIANVSSIHYYGLDGADLGNYFVSTGTNAEAEFLGVLFAPKDPPVGHVVITLGDAALDPGTNDGGFFDLVVLDDIVFSEPLGDEIFADGFE